MELNHLLPILLLSFCTCVLSAESDLSQSAYLDPKERFHIEWEYTDTNITITARVKTTGWFGLGFSPNGGMAGADIITAGFANGKPYLQDRYAERNGYPAVDDSQDVQLLSGSQENGVTTIKFTRKHTTCDSKDMPIGTDTVRLIYAISADGSDTVSYHAPSNRGTRSIYLRRKISVDHSIPDDAVTIDVTVKDVIIPATRTTYHCEAIKAQKAKTKHHMIKVEPIIQPENLGLVHHIIIYGCYGSGIDLEHLFESKKTGHQCFSPNMPNDMKRCRAAIAVWAVGGGAVHYPDEAGFPFEDGKSPDYYMMEVHYDNPQHIAGRRDNSGLRLTLTKKLRKYDAGIMGTGSVRGITIPPGVKDFKYSGFCSGDCTRKLVKSPLSVFGAYLHGHLAARAISARQFRNGKELRIIDQDRKYDFNYQQYKMLDKPFDFLPGDDVMVTCHYNTEDRTKMTFGGNPSTSEMCITYLYYYPAQDISDCFSAPGWAGEVSQTTYFAKSRLGFSSLDKSYKYIPGFTAITSNNLWTEDRIKALEDGHLTFPQYDSCKNKVMQKVIQGGKGRYMSPVSSMDMLSSPGDNNQCNLTVPVKQPTLSKLSTTSDSADSIKPAAATKLEKDNKFGNWLKQLSDLLG